MAPLKVSGVASLIFAVVACVQPQMHSEAVLNAGPMLGDITTDSVQIWAAADTPMRFSVELKTADGEWQAAVNNPVLLLSNSTHPRGSCEITGLSADTEYQYRLVTSDGVVEAESTQQFRTSGAYKFRVAFGSCAGDWGPDPSQ